MQRPIILLTLGLALGGCGSSHDSSGGDSSGGDGNDSSSSAGLGTCGLRTEVSGGTTIHFTGKDDAACLTLHSTGTGIDAVFSGTDAKGSLELIVDTVTEGQTGADFPTLIVVSSTAREKWQGSGCTTSLTEHHLLRVESSTLGELRHYQVSGQGSCTDALDSVSTGASPTTVGPFAFRAEFTWRD